MENNEKRNDVLNGLVEINNDRIEGYQKAAQETDASDLKSLFSKMAADSTNFRNELTAEIQRTGGTPAEGTTVSGKFYRAWMDVKAALSGKDRHAVLSSCEFGEDAALDAYEEALKDDALKTSPFKAKVELQRSEIKKSHDQIKSLRDSIVA